MLVTGGSGFFGSILKNKLLASGIGVVNIDLQRDEDLHAGLISIQGDIRDEALMGRIYRDNRFDAVFHCAAILAHDMGGRNFLWTSNVDGTRVVAAGARQHGVSNLVFTSSNSLWGKGYRRPIAEDEPPMPVEIYGRSKLQGERVLKGFAEDLNIVSIRCPTIVDSGRLGLLAILFEFIAEGRKVWAVGGGRNRYQFICAQDLADACLRAASLRRSDVFNIGSDDVKPIREIYRYVIERAGTGARVVALPESGTLLAMRMAHALKISPLGPYHYRMIAEDFLFDTRKIKAELCWQPTLTNEEMLAKAYVYYQENRAAIERRTGVSAHKQAAGMGVIRLLKWLS
ncbi:MAG: NAD-dependent epimerase/dehydratase family protein [Bryobacteraceae bacterium]